MAATLTPARPLPEALLKLLCDLTASGWTAECPETLDPEAETIARLERQDP